MTTHYFQKLFVFTLVVVVVSSTLNSEPKLLRSKRASRYPDLKCEGDSHDLAYTIKEPRGVTVNPLWPTESPIRKYKTGPNGRIEFVEAIIKEPMLSHGTSCTTGQRGTAKWAQDNGKRGDVCGHIIAKSLGGPGHLQYNIFPQNSVVNNGAWKSVEGITRKFLKDKPRADRVANLQFDFVYEDPTTPLRPTRFNFVYNLFEGTEFILNCVYHVTNQ